MASRTIKAIKATDFVRLPTNLDDRLVLARVVAGRPSGLSAQYGSSPWPDGSDDRQVLNRLPKAAQERCDAGFSAVRCGSVDITSQDGVPTSTR